jgi:hypothetical protein
MLELSFENVGFVRGTSIRFNLPTGTILSLNTTFGLPTPGQSSGAFFTFLANAEKAQTFSLEDLNLWNTK